MSETTTTTLGNLMERNVTEIFGERDRDRRERAIAELYTDDCAFYDPDGESIGRPALADRAQRILDQNPQDFAIRVVGPAEVLYDLGRVRWQVGPPGTPPVVSGMDVAVFAIGKIRAMYTFIETPSAAGDERPTGLTDPNDQGEGR